jgi:8-oxo-dGTP pyrophosphatase MutT (NUDIX family)
MLVRDSGGSGGNGGSGSRPGTEVFMLRRVAGMAFAPSTMVFPGGGVDTRDGDVDLPWAGPSPAEWAELLGCSAAEAQMYVAAAVREVFEECGVLLASPSVDGPLAQVDGERWRQVRDDLISRASSLGQVLAGNGLVLRSDLIAAKAHWLTPVFEPRRFDTWFFAALMPSHQLADGDTSEADEAGWVVPDDLLREYAAGSALMLPPTVVCVEQIRDAGSAAEFVMHTEELPLIMPEVVEGPSGPAMVVEQLVEPAERQP